MGSLSPVQSHQLNDLVDHSDPATGQKRRRRAAVACRDCRLRKTKCDHIVPTSATNDMLRGMNKAAQMYVRSLERRLRNFEDKQREYPRPMEYPSLPILTPGTTSSNHPEPAQYGQSTVLTDGQQQQTIITASPEIFMGGKAGESFTQLILNAMNWGSAKLETRIFSSPRNSNKELKESDLFTPPSTARDLIKAYFDFHHVLTPIFHAPSMMAEFEQVLSCESSHPRGDRHTLAIMNMVCAIASAHDLLGFGGSESTARKYYDTAMQLVLPTLLSDWSIKKVQVLLLGARYLQVASSPAECWNVLGLAVRIAYGLELHRPPPERLDCLSKEVHKRVWYACYGLDQLLSMIYGRPTATSAATSTTPLPEDLDDDLIQPTRLLHPSVKTPSSLSFFIQVSKLYRLLESASSLSNPTLETLVRLDEDLQAWYSEIPPSLKVQDGVSVQDDKALILALRANAVRILIHRQSLVPALNALSTREDPPGPSGPLRFDIMQKSRQICVSTAEETIHLVGLRHDQTMNAVGPTWFNLYYLFNAILIIVSHVIDPKFHEDQTALTNLEQAMHMIRQMSVNHFCAQRAYTFLQQLLELLDKTLPHDQKRIRTRAERNSIPPSTNESLMTDKNLSVELNTDLWSFWGATQDLTMDLGSQLDLQSDLGPAMLSWDV